MMRVGVRCFHGGRLLLVVLASTLVTVLGGSSATAAETPPSRAYVTNAANWSVTPIEGATNTPGPEIKVGRFPTGVAITPNGKTVYVVNTASESVTPIEVATNTPGPEIKVGKEPRGVAITPNGKTVYVTNEGSATVTPIEVATNTPGPEIKVGNKPHGVAITPNGETVYVINKYNVTPIEVATNTPGPEIKVGTDPLELAITPNGKTAYVTNAGSATVTPIELATNTPGPEIKVCAASGVAITPNGKTVYVTNGLCNSVTPIEVATNTPGPEIKVGCNPLAVAFTPDGGTAYVVNQGCATVTPIEVATNTPGPEIKVGQGADEVAITSLASAALVTEAASAVTQTSATLNAVVNPNEELVSECEFEYGTSPSYGSAMPCIPAPGFGPSPVAVSAAISGLRANAEYHFRISAITQGGTSTGLDQSFKTLPLEIPQPPAQPPAITGASLTNRRFRVATQGTAISAGRAPLGTSVHFTLSAAAKLQIAITRSVTGLRHDHSCVAVTRALTRAHTKPCTRMLTLGTLTRSIEPQGADIVPFSGRIGQRALSPGVYDAALLASDTAGRSKPVTLAFVVVR